MARDKVETQRIVRSFRDLALQGENPTMFQIIDGWRLLEQLEKAIGKFYQSVHVNAVIWSILQNISPVYTDKDFAFHLLKLETTMELREGHTFIEGCTLAEKEAIVKFAEAMRQAIVQLPSF